MALEPKRSWTLTLFVTSTGSPCVFWRLDIGGKALWDPGLLLLAANRGQHDFCVCVGCSSLLFVSVLAVLSTHVDVSMYFPLFFPVAQSSFYLK